MRALQPADTPRPQSRGAQAPICTTLRKSAKLHTPCFHGKEGARILADRVGGISSRSEAPSRFPSGICPAACANHSNGLAWVFHPTSDRRPISIQFSCIIALANYFVNTPSYAPYLDKFFPHAV